MHLRLLYKISQTMIYIDRMSPIGSSPSPVGHNIKTPTSHLQRAFTIAPQLKLQQRPRPLPTLAAADNNKRSTVATKPTRRSLATKKKATTTPATSTTTSTSINKATIAEAVPTTSSSTKNLNSNNDDTKQQHADTTNTTASTSSSTNGTNNSKNNGAKTAATPDGGLEQQQEISDALKEIIKRRQQRKQSSFSSPTSNSIGAPTTTRTSPNNNNSSKADLSKADKPQQQQLATISPSSPPPPPPPAPMATLTTKVRFWLQFHAEWGQRLRVVGSSPELGTWALDKGIELAWSEGDNWHCIVDIPAGKVVEYKYVLLDHSGHHAIAWQQGNNSVLALRSADSFVEVFDNWGSTPGAKLVADGAEPVTRENRLLAWATEIEVQMASHKQELRRARMELAAAQEDAKIARMETAKVKMELKESESARVEAVGKLKYAETTNQILQTKMLETTLSFREVMEKAANLLSDIDSELEKATTKKSSVGKKEKL